ncbi:MAG: tRNA (adenosine(37)-N6)-dimethylallyltransferase MiaA [Dermatophilaceae bacterium]
MTPTPAPRPIIAIVGPTATGKSALALALAERLGAEVVNADAMALYRGMDIGTAKVTLAERRGIPHHQLDVLEPWEEASVAAYQQAARADLAAIADRGHRAVLVGGSGLYVRAALDALDIPPTDAVVREALEAELAADGPAPLVARLTAQDPTAAATIDPRNLRRVVRALEVIALTGRPFSASLPTRSFVAPTTVLGLSADLADPRRSHRHPHCHHVGPRDDSGSRGPPSRLAGPGQDRAHRYRVCPSSRTTGRGAD